MLNLAVLTCNARSYSARRLVAVAQEHGIDARVYDTLRFSLFVAAERPSLYYDGERFEAEGAVLPRIGASVTTFGLAVVRQLERLGVVSVNSADAIARSRDKLRSAQLLAAAGVRIPKTAFVRHPESIGPAVDRLGGAPVVVKTLEGTQGIGVVLADTTEVAEAVVQALHGARQHVLVQEFVRESRGRDVRAFVVGGRVVAAMRRLARHGEFRSNVHRGGRGDRIALEPDLERTALEATRVLGLEVAGVDLVEGKDGPLVLEVNASPGLEAIERITGSNVAGAVIEHVLGRARAGALEPGTAVEALALFGSAGVSSG